MSAKNEVFCSSLNWPSGVCQAHSSMLPLLVAETSTSPFWQTAAGEMLAVTMVVAANTLTVNVLEMVQPAKSDTEAV